MPAALASRAREPTSSKSRAGRNVPPPAKKTKLSQPTAAARINGFSALLNGKQDKKLSVKSNGFKNAPNENVDETTAVVARGLDSHGDVDMADASKEVIEISSADEESDYGSSEDEDEVPAPVTNGHADEDDRPVEDGTAEPEELTFAERLQAQDPGLELEQAPRIVDVESAYHDPNDDSNHRATTSHNRALSAPSASSLGTVLTQALRTNDQDLLDSCLRVLDVDTIYATVERLPSPLVGNLLQKLAERLYRKPGRAGILMVWVQWSLAAHGGYLASQPQLVKRLATLNKVLKERACGLQPLLSLKGRLDMIQAQLELRRRNQRRAADDHEEEAVIYIEGEDDASSVEGGSEPLAGSDTALTSPRKRVRQDFDDDDNETSTDEMPTTMEVDVDSDEGSEDSEDLIDDEAEETDNDTGDNLSEPMSDDDVDDAEDISGSDEESKPTRRSTVGRSGLARRY